MRVTKLEEVRGMHGGRRRLWVDGERVCLIYRSDIRRFRLCEGEEVSSADLAELCDVVLYKRALERLYYLLERRSYTREELLRKLLQGEYPREVADRALDTVEAYGYVDDSAYAQRYIESHIGTKSCRSIRMDLLRKGVGRDAVDDAMEDAMQHMASTLPAAWAVAADGSVHGISAGAADGSIHGISACEAEGSCSGLPAGAVYDSGVGGLGGAADGVAPGAWAYAPEEDAEAARRQIERAQIRRLLAKRHYDAAKADTRERQKQYVYLRGKGYASDDIRDCLR